MKKYFLLAIILFLLSCDKEVQLDGTTWMRSDDVVRLEFKDNQCTWTRNPGDLNYELSHTAGYEYDHPDIEILLPMITGYEGYQGSVSKKEMKLLPLQTIWGEDTSYVTLGNEEIFHLQ